MRPEIHGSGAFFLEVEGIAAASFARCEGLGASRAVFAYHEGGAPRPRLLAGDETFTPIVLERGLARDRELFEWFRRAERRDGAVVLLDPGGREVARWTFARGWPSRWEGPELDAGEAAVALERLEIVHEGLAWAPR